jgi:hypothetical protein
MIIIIVVPSYSCSWYTCPLDIGGRASIWARILWISAKDSGNLRFREVCVNDLSYSLLPLRPKSQRVWGNHNLIFR